MVVIQNVVVIKFVLVKLIVVVNLIQGVQLNVHLIVLVIINV